MSDGDCSSRSRSGAGDLRRRARCAGESRYSAAAGAGRGGAVRLSRNTVRSEQVGLGASVDRRSLRAVGLERARLPAVGADCDGGGRGSRLGDAAVGVPELQRRLARVIEVEPRITARAVAKDRDPEVLGRPRVRVTKVFGRRGRSVRLVVAGRGNERAVAREEAEVEVLTRNRPVVPFQEHASLLARHHRDPVRGDAGREVVDIRVVGIGRERATPVILRVVPGGVHPQDSVRTSVGHGRVGRSSRAGAVAATRVEPGDRVVDHLHAVRDRILLGERETNLAVDAH